ncbi:AAA family ATPase [Marmoricola sp. RAF53]|uniref:AAA family ATPase n=1 Tax=Marmoricola sp. RAF53 TaxID=3233059 RepID=UPI003F9649F7
MPVLVESDSAWATALVSGLPAGTQVVANAAQLDNWLMHQGEEYAVVVGPNIGLEEAISIASVLHRTRPTTDVVLLRHELSSDVFQQAMRAGIPAVVGAADIDGMSAAVVRARQTWEAIKGPDVQRGDKDGKVITVFSPKGGVGKTTVAVNLAIALGANGAARVCIVDLDLAFGDVAITLQLIPEHTVLEAVGTEEHLDFSLLETLLTRHETCSILAAPTHPEGKDRISPGLVRRVLQILRTQFDYVVVDAAPSFDDQVLHAFAETNECVLVATLDVPTVKNTKLAIETLDALDLVPGNRHLLLNRADDEVGLSPANVESLLKMPVAVALPSALAVANATNHGRPIVLSRPEHPVSRTFVQLAGMLSGARDGKSVSTAPNRPIEEPEQKRRFGRRRK